MPVVPFIPLIASGVSAGVGALMSKKAQKGAMQRSPEELQALGGAQQAAGQTGEAGQQFLGQAQPMIEQSGNYYNSLLRGNRAAQMQAVAPGMANITDLYRGATRNLTQQGVTGAARDVASADLNRQRASQLAGLVTGVQPAAAGALADLGTKTGNLGGQLSQTSGNIYANLLGQGWENRKYARGEGQEAGKAWGALAADVINAPWPGTNKGPQPLASSRAPGGGRDLPPSSYLPRLPAPNNPSQAGPNPQATYNLLPTDERGPGRYSGHLRPYQVMAWLEGLITGISGRRREIEAENTLKAAQAAEREFKVYEHLLDSPDPEVRAMAGTGLLGLSQPQKRKRSLQGWMGEMEQNPTYAKLLQYLQTPKVTGYEQKVTQLPSLQGTGLTYLPEVPPQNTPAALPETSPTEPGTPPLAAPQPLPQAEFPALGRAVQQAGVGQLEPPTPRAPFQVPPPSFGAPAPPPAPPAPFRSQVTEVPETPSAPPAPPSFAYREAPGRVERGAPIMGLPQAFPTAEDKATAARRAQIMGDFQALEAMYIKNGLSPEEAAQRASQDVVAFHQRTSPMTNQSLELEWTDETGKVHRELGTYDRVNRRYLDGRSQPIPYTVTRALPASAQGMGVYVNQAMREMNVTQLDMRNDPELARQVIQRSQELAAEQAGDITGARNVVNANRQLNTAERTNLTTEMQGRWNTLQAPVRKMELYLREMGHLYQRYKAGDRTAWEPLRIAFVRVFEPDSVVMPSEFARATGTSSILQTVYGTVGRLLEGGATLTDGQVDEVMRAAGAVWQAIQGYNNGQRQAIAATIQPHGIPEEQVFGPGLPGLTDIMGAQSAAVAAPPPPPPPAPVPAPGGTPAPAPAPGGITLDTPLIVGPDGRLIVRP